VADSNTARDCLNYRQDPELRPSPRLPPPSAAPPPDSVEEALVALVAQMAQMRLFDSLRLV